MPIWRRCALVAEISEENGQRVALLNLVRRRPVVLAGSAAAIWSLVDGTRTEADIVGELLGLYGEDASAEMADQVIAFLAELEEQGLAEAEA